MGGARSWVPLVDSSIDIVYARQVLHHAAELERLMSEVARVLRPGGVLMACREHVVDSESQKQAFLNSHPVHRLAGGECLFPSAVPGCDPRQWSFADSPD